MANEVIEKQNFQPTKLNAFGSVQEFQEIQRMAVMLSKSNMVPDSFKNNIGDCVIALDMSIRMNANVLALMQNLVIIHGKPSWSSQFVISCINTCGKFSPLRFKFNSEKTSCYAYAVELSTGEILEGSTITIQMAKDEKWFDKPGSKWKTMPEQMLRYRAGSFFGRIYAPEILMGMNTSDEMYDIEITTDKTNDKIASETFDTSEIDKKEINQVEKEQKSFDEITKDGYDIDDKDEPDF